MFNLKKVELLERQLHNAEATCVRLRKSLEIYESKEPKRKFAIFSNGNQVTSVLANFVITGNSCFRFVYINEFGVEKTAAEYSISNYAYKEIK